MYSADNQGHFGLNYEAYTHFTSPIRRYPDLLTHRAIRSVIHSKQNTPHVRRAGAMTIPKARIYPYDEAALEQLGEQCSMSERRADEATRDVVNWLKCEFMKDRVGESFPGVITAVTGFGLFVELTDIYVEGLVHAFNPGVHFAALGLADLDPVFVRQLDQRLDPRVIATFGQPDLLHAFRVVTQQRFYSMYAVDLFQLTHGLALGLRAPPLLAGAEPAFGGPLRCLLGLAGLPPTALSGVDRLVFPPDAALPPLFAPASNACFISRLLRTSAFFAAASLGR